MAERMTFSKLFHETVGKKISDIRGRLASEKLKELKGAEVSLPTPIFISQFAGADKKSIEERYGKINDEEASKRFGARDLDEFSYWAWRSCGIAGVAMIIRTVFGNTSNKKIMNFINEGLLLGGYDVKKDVGWYHSALIKLAGKYGIEAETKKFIPPIKLALYLNENKYVMASIKSDFGGHLLLLYGFKVNEKGELDGFYYHDPNTYFEDGQNKFINKSGFEELFTRRAIVFNTGGKK